VKHLNTLSAIKDLLNPLYNHTRCPVCMYVVNVDRHGLMEAHGSGQEPCVASGHNDEEVARELDAAVAADRERQAGQTTDLLAEK
jgi:hypothetical protein